MWTSIGLPFPTCKMKTISSIITMCLNLFKILRYYFEEIVGELWEFVI